MNSLWGRWIAIFPFLYPCTSSHVSFLSHSSPASHSVYFSLSLFPATPISIWVSLYLSLLYSDPTCLSFSLSCSPCYQLFFLPLSPVHWPHLSLFSSLLFSMTPIILFTSLSCTLAPFASLSLSCSRWPLLFSYLPLSPVLSFSLTQSVPLLWRLTQIFYISLPLTPNFSLYLSHLLWPNFPISLSDPISLSIFLNNISLLIWPYVSLSISSWSAQFSLSLSKKWSTNGSKWRFRKFPINIKLLWIKFLSLSISLRVNIPETLTQICLFPSTLSLTLTFWLLSFVFCPLFQCWRTNR